jgi:hypothetical protein
MRTLQGVILGVVLTIPVVLWAYTRVHAGSETGNSPVAAMPNAAPTRTSHKSAPAVTTRKKAAPVAEVETIPASEMHIRIDDGSRPAQAPGSPTAVAKPAPPAGNEDDEDQNR